MSNTGATGPASSIRATFQAHYTIGIIGSGILLTMIPVTLLVPVLKELVSIRFSVSNFWAHAFMSTSLLGGILFAPFAGILIDRVKNRQWIIGIALLGNAVCFWGMATAGSFTMLMISRFLEGAMHITALTAWMATAADLSSKGRIGRMMGALSGVIILGITIGVPMGGVIAGEDSQLVLWAAVVFSLLAACIAALLRTPPREHEEKKSGSRMSQLRAMIQERPEMLVPYTYSFIDRLCIGVVVSTLTIYMTDVLQFTPAERGMQLSYFLIPLALLSYPVGRISDRIGRTWLMVIGSVIFGLVFMTYGYVSGIGLTIAMLASGIFSAAMFAPTLTMCKDFSTPETHGLAFSGYNIAGSLGFVVGPLLGGALYTVLADMMPIIDAYRYTFLLTGTFEILCALISLPFLLKLLRAGKTT